MHGNHLRLALIQVLHNPSLNLKSRLAERYLNLSQSLEIAESNYIWTATQWQRRQPQSIRNKMIAIHEGLTQTSFPLHLRQKIKSEVLITYTTRGLEPIRAFDHFINIANHLMSLRGDIRLIIVGKDKPSYRPLPKNSKSMQEIALSTFKKSGNGERVAWVDRMTYKDYRNLLRISDLHVYLSRPFIASWSLLEAMSCGCCIVASDLEMCRESVKICFLCQSQKPR